jgi:acyl-CoA reductase-like NAD-dependent aldehyde dehydrogenase
MAERGVMKASPDVLHFIDGAARPSLGGETFLTFDPSKGTTHGVVAFGQAEDVDLAVSAAWRAYDGGHWRNLAPRERARRLRRIADLIRERLDSIAERETRDCGKPLRDARADVAAAASLIDYFATVPENVRGTVYAEEVGHFAYSRREPYGVVGAIAPWNFPFLNAVWKTIAALAVGNSVVLKMAEQSPVTSTLYAELCAEAGVPQGVLNVVHGDGPTTGAALACHPGVPKITFTGSTEVGKLILHYCADAVKSCHLELGGKTPNIVFADADLNQALAGSLFTSFFNSGQICTSGSRLLVQEGIAEEFLSALLDRVRGMRVGNPFEETTHLGPLISAEQLERVNGYIEDGIKSGARVLHGGRRPTEPELADGYYLQPTVFDEITSDMKLGQEEIFGPVLSVLKFASDAEALSLANSVTYGLAATVWTRDLQRAMTAAERLEAGIIWTNAPHHMQWNIPYEGHKDSGLGEDLGLESIATFTRLKVNYMNFGGGALDWA